ncbi:MAG: FAD-binding oxidoreductase, partial [Acidimicrobiia bacterium]|nr:FAD-binding oxidoreductase [Acidimicrobiia bacterium]
HMARAGVDVVLVERGLLGSGSTSKAIGGIRASFNHPTNIEIGLYGRQVFSTFEEDFDQPVGYTKGGYLYLIDDTIPMEQMEASVALQNSYGVVSRLIDPAEAHRLSPMINQDHCVAALWSPDDGRAEPEAAVAGYARAARREGATLRTGVTVTGIEVQDGEIRSVETDHEIIETGTVINCAGAWAPQIGAMVGIDLPIEPYRRQVVITEDAAHTLPSLETLTIDLASAFYFHQEGRRFTIGFSDPAEKPGFNIRFDPTDWLPRMVEHAGRCAPDLLDLGIRSSYAGLYAVTPDHNQIVGEHTRIGRFLYAAGFSGHGFQMGPAMGRILTSLYLGEAPFIDVSSLGVERFEGEGSQRHEAFIV